MLHAKRNVSLFLSLIIVPIIKDKSRRINDKYNYRPIGFLRYFLICWTLFFLTEQICILKLLLIKFDLNLNTGRTCVVAYKEMLRFDTEYGSNRRVFRRIKDI